MLFGGANCVPTKFQVGMKLFYYIRNNNGFCAGSQTESIPVQLYAVSEDYSNLAKYLHQCLFSNCRDSLSYVPCCHCNWPHAGHFHHSPGKLLAIHISISSFIGPHKQLHVFFFLFNIDF